MRPHCALAPLGSTPLVALTLLCAAQWAPITAAEPRIVYNGPSPRGGVQKLSAVELWRAGGEEDEQFFGAIAQVTSDAAGNIYLLDSQRAQVMVYSADGSYRGSLSREGTGPGEVQHPVDLFVLPDGTLGLVQPFPGKVIKVDRDGTPGGTMTYRTGAAGQGGFAALVRGLVRGGVYVLGGVRMSYGNDGTGREVRFLSRCSDQGMEEHCYVSLETAVNYNDFSLRERTQSFAWRRCDLDSEGRLYVAPAWDRYRIEVHNAEGELEWIIERDYESLERDPYQRVAARARLEAYARYYPTPPREITIEDTEPDIASLWVAPDGRLWVRTSRGDHDRTAGIITTFDVFDRDGQFAQQISLTGLGDPQRDLLYLLGGDQLVVVVEGVGAVLSQQGVSLPDSEERGEPAALEIICCRLLPRD